MFQDDIENKSLFKVVIVHMSYFTLCNVVIKSKCFIHTSKISTFLFKCMEAALEVVSLVHIAALLSLIWRIYFL